MNKHTPGPWKAVAVKSALSIKAHDGCVTIANIGWMLRQNYPESEANAKLIAAAPVLLEALLQAEAELSRLHSPKSALTTIRAAIAKAEQP